MRYPIYHTRQLVGHAARRDRMALERRAAWDVREGVVEGHSSRGSKRGVRSECDAASITGGSARLNGARSTPGEEEMMGTKDELNRRTFLRLSAVGAGGAVVVACGGGDGSPTAGAGGATPGVGEPTPDASTAPVGGATNAPEAQPTTAADVTRATAAPAVGSFKESPTLKAMADGGKLPPVAQRLPKNPYVVPHQWLSEGRYGGTMRMGGQGTDAFATSGIVHESMYGHSLLRFLKDGLEIGPGLVEEWSPNKDQTEWTLKLREGLKWSDGKPFSTEDIMYWWEDMVLNEEHPETAPDDVRSGKGTIGKVRAVDAVTFRLTFDAPAPITPERLAAWTNRGIGPHWMAPKHYMRQYHPKYNPKLKGKKDWTTEHDAKLLFRQNPGSPVMTGWVLKSFREGQQSIWERNPYYWCVDRAGNQLPYIDQVIYTPSQDAEIMKLQFQQGKVDYVTGNHTPLAISDYAGLKKSEQRSGLEVRFWDSGSGSGSAIFFNLDYPDKKLRDLIRNPKFRQALSHAYNRPEVQKSVYYGTGEVTTGTLSPKGYPFNANAEGRKRYREWRDSYVKYDPAKAKQMLDALDLRDRNGDGFREMPDGSKLTINIDYHADAAREHTSKNALLAKHWKAVGIDAKINPVPPISFDDRWTSGKLMSNADWGIGDNHPLIYPGWVIPVEASHWAPLHGAAFAARGTAAERKELDKDPWKRQPPRISPRDKQAFYEPVGRLWRLYDQARVETNSMKRMRLLWDIFKVHVDDGPFIMGVVANFPRAVLVKKGLKNVPTGADLKKYALGGWTDPWIIPAPATYDPETFYWDDPAAHT